MKKITVILVAIAIAALSSAATVAATGNQYANDIKKFSVDYMSLWEGKVAVFDDGPNKCYVASYMSGNDRPSIAISCVKR
jgi:hypothetical protein